MAFLGKCTQISFDKKENRSDIETHVFVKKSYALCWKFLNMTTWYHTQDGYKDEKFEGKVANQARA